MKHVVPISVFLMFFGALLSAQSGKVSRVIDPDKAYKNNCMRCHAETPQYSARKTATIMMHMRVRANLPEDEARAILAYLNGTSPEAEVTPTQPAAMSKAGGK